MKNYDVRIIDEKGNMNYCDMIVAKNENEAVLEVLSIRYVNLKSGDTLKVTELQ